MPVSIPRKLDAHEVGILTVLEKFTDPISVTRLTRRVEPPTLSRSEINQALNRLETDGYIRCSRPNLRGPRYYAIEFELRSTVGVQVALKGEVDIYTLDDWVLAAMWYSGALDKQTAVGSVWVWGRLTHEWGKTVPAAAVANALLNLATVGFLSSDLSGSFSRFYVTFRQRDRIRDKILPDFPLLPGRQAKVAKPATKQGVQPGEGPMSAFLTESGKVALRVLYRNGQDMTAQEVGKYFYKIYVEPRSGPLHDPNKTANARTLAASAALRKLSRDGYITRLTQRLYVLTSEQRNLVHLHFPKWKTKADPAPARIPVPYEAVLGPIERLVLQGALEAAFSSMPFDFECVRAAMVELGTFAKLGRTPNAVLHFMLNQLVNTGAVTALDAEDITLTDRQIVMAKQVLGLEMSDDVLLEEPQSSPETRNGRAIELD